VREVAHGSFLILVGQVISTVVLAVSIIFIAGILGAEKYGEYKVVMVPINIVILLMDFGTNSSLTRALAIYQGSSSKTSIGRAAYDGFFINILSALFFSSLLFLFSDVVSDAFLHRPELSGILKIASFCVLGLALTNTTNAIFLGLSRLELRSFNNILLAVLRSVSTIIIVYLGYGVSGFVLANMTMEILSGLVGVLIIYILMKRNNIATRFELDEVYVLLKAGTPFYLTGLVANGLNQIYNSLMVLYASTPDIGNYGVALNFAILATFLTGPIGTMLFPLFSKIKSGDPTLKKLYQDSVKYMSLITLPGAMALIALADPLLTVIYRDEYILASSFLKLYLITFLYVGLGNISTSNILNGQGRADINMRSSIITLVLGSILASILAPKYSIMGILTAMIIAPLPGLLYSYFFVRRTYGLSINWSSSIKLFTASLTSYIVSTICINLVNYNPWIELISGGILFIITYLIAIKITAVLEAHDYDVFRSILGESSTVNPLRRMLDIYEKL
jgi:lipopolysaccharide exporter